MKALSIRNPWCWLILNAGKNIENRSWLTKFRGEFAIHASAGMTRAEYAEVADFLDGDLMGVKLPPSEQLERGGIVGVATITDVVRDSDSPWFFGPVGFVLADARPVPFIPYKGRLGFFELPADIVSQIAGGKS